MPEDLDDVPARGRLDGLADLTHFEAERCVSKFSDHGTFCKPAQVTTLILCPGIGGGFLGKFSKVLTLVQTQAQIFSGRLIVDQDMACPDLFLIVWRTCGDGV